ncbi:LacI family DNA-binding transcriptional regulator [Bifidobacterium vespertilionis]|uniref:LacI family DNA-binding transcriptional regulator n=1 Tax=Bifidobacterium vespertilionis TaxID=2562524 RepID=UPI001BDC8063|nr:LacI family DNA-binding transcriptional regulator [Bifidobacterium vespertilionis]MBT1178236.1 LacI family DNA-binding transcriptional regulator [Bifidobacterium vespertilionis]
MSETSRAVKRRVTLRDVAQAADVSLKTASNVINGNGRMSEETRQRVKDVIRDLGYQVNVAARNLNRHTTGFITLAVPTLTAPYLAELADRVIGAARARDYAVYVTTYAELNRGAQLLLRSFNATVSDGMILSMSEVEKFRPEDLRVDYPLVCTGARTTWDAADLITPDDVDAAAQATRFLFEHGSRSIAAVGVRTPIDRSALLRAVEGNAELRLRGILEECDRQGHPFDTRLGGFTGYNWTIGSGFHATQALIDSGVPFDGVVALNDQLAIGVISALKVNGLSIPGDVQVIGFDNIEEAAYLETPLTTMDSRLEWLAPTAVDRILERIGGGADEPKLLTERSRVIARATTRG